MRIHNCVRFRAGINTAIALAAMLLCGVVPAQAQYDIYRANLHVHTSASCPDDGLPDHCFAGDPEETIIQAQSQGIKVIGKSDHAGSMTDSEWDWPFYLGDTHGDSSGTIALRGFEWTWKGSTDSDHINVFGTSDKIEASGTSVDAALATLFHWLETASMSSEYGGGCDKPIAQFNHIFWGTHFQNFSGWNSDLEDIFCLAEIGCGEAPGPYNVGTNNEGVSDGSNPINSEPYYNTALQNGWHVAPTIGIDNQTGIGDPAATRHTAIWVTPGSGRAGVMDALRLRRVFASEDIDISIRFRVRRNSDSSWHWMGETIWADPNGILLYVDASDPSGMTKDQFQSVDLMSSASSTPYYKWGQVDTTTLAQSHDLSIQELLATSKTALDQTCFYVRLRQKGTAGAEQDYIYSAPIWIKYWTAVSGTIADDTTWSPDNNPYVVKGQVTVASGTTLTIQSGTVIKFADSSSGLTVNGHVVAQGTSGSPIYFTSFRDDSTGGDTNYDGNATSPAKGDWGGIYVDGELQSWAGGGWSYSGTANLDHCIIRYGGAGNSSHRGIVSVYTDSNYYGVKANLSLTNCDISGAFEICGQVKKRGNPPVYLKFLS